MHALHTKGVCALWHEALLSSALALTLTLPAEKGHYYQAVLCTVGMPTYN